ncbi:recombinase family protein [Sphingobium abikonense]|uniref:recombinase family protein n=1 Tax=Sphingobium abikonense TaxID=86193 RepID=UPI001FE1E2F9|nr:recombinase family protein [Sphingobium abikonense]
MKKIGDDGEIVRGLLEVNEEEAAIVRRIFEETLAGVSSRAIVKALNEEGVPSPSGGLWATNVIHGDRIRANGILRNNLYRGVMVYGRTRRAYHPKTRRYVSRVNPVNEWRFVDVPHLRIVSDEHWAAIEAHYAAFDGDIRTKKRHPKRLLSGLGKCSVCGGTWTVISPEKWGCSTAKNKQACTNTRTISTGLYEKRTLGHLKAILLNPDAIELFVERYNIGIQKRRAEVGANRAPLEKNAADLRARISRLVDAIADGAGEFQEFKDRLRTARADLANVEQQLQALIEAAPIVLPHDLADRYRTIIAELDVALATEGTARERAASAIRELIEAITLSPKTQGRGVEIQVTGRMANIINLAKDSA